MAHFWVAVLLTLAFNSVYCSDYLSILHAESSDDPSKSKYFCTMYNSDYQSLPSNQESAEKYKVKDLMPSKFCENPPDDPGVKGKLAIVSRGNCSFVEKANRTEYYGGSAVVIVSSEGLIIPDVRTVDKKSAVNISIVVMTKYDYNIMKNISSKLTIQLFALHIGKIDYSLLIIWLLAVITIVLGSIWSGKVRHKQWLSKRRRRRSSEVEAQPEEEDTEDGHLHVSPVAILVMVFLMCGMLIALYFLYDYLVFVIIALFVVASTSSLYAVFKLALIRMPFIGDCKIPENNLPLLKHRPEIRRIILYLMCLAVGIWWAIERHANYAWILQNILGIFFCVNMMKTIRLPSFKACTILLTLLFIYDIFFVFITPLLTKSGESIMVDVATGGSSQTGEMLPMVLKVPRLMLNHEAAACYLPYSLLGFGDILVPGLLISYNYGFDLIVGSPKSYFIASLIGYGLGLVATFIALAVMATGQPALLYLVPFTLLTTLIVALKRKEVKQLWEGPDTGNKEETPNNSTMNVNQPTPTPDPQQRSGSPVRRQVSREFNIAKETEPDATSVASSTGNEHQQLIPR